jgi:glucokinase
MISLASPVEPLAFPVLIGDVGGTNVRFALIPDIHAEPRPFPPERTAAYPGLAEAVEAMVLARTSLVPNSAVLAVAGPVRGEAIHLTNADWVVRPSDLLARLGLGDIVLLNDFEALALALTALRSRDVEPIGDGKPEPAGPKVVLGPGTGLGMAGLVPAGHQWAPVPGEGGHMALGPAEPDEFRVWQAMEPEHGRISAEAVLAGRGLVRLYRAVAATLDAPAPLDAPEEVSAAGLSGEDPAAARTLAFYCRILGRLAGDLALIFMATGGIYIAGGIAPRLVPFLRTSEFRAAFEAKAPHQALMARIPTSVIVAEQPALAGLTAFARSPGRFAIALSGRRWRAPVSG